MATNSQLPFRGAQRCAVLVLASLAGVFVLLGACSEVSYGSTQLGGWSLASANGYGWPVKPFDRQHPVRGFFGDIR